MSRSISRVIWLVAALALLLPGALAAQTQPAPPRALSLEEAISLARQNNPEFLSQQNDIDAARWGVRSAYGSLLPTANASQRFGYTASGPLRLGPETFGERPEYYTSTYNIGLNYEVSGTRILQPTVARAQARATEERVAGAEANLVAQVTQQYLSVLQAEEIVAQSEREVARTGEHVRLAQARLEVGAGTSLDVRRAEVQQGQAQVRLLQAQNLVATETLLLGRLVGTPLQPGLQLTSEFQLIEPQLQSEQLYATALRNNPVLLASRAAADAAQTRVSATRTNYLPSLNFNVGWQGSVYQAGNIDPLVENQLRQAQNSFGQCLEFNNIRTAVGMAPANCRNPADPAVHEQIRSAVRADNSGFPFDYERQPLSAGVTISLPLFTGLNRQQQIAEARVAAQDARYQVRSEQLRLQAEVATAILNVQTGFRTAQLQAVVRATAAEELRLAEERFRFGAASSIEVTDAQTRLAETEQAEIDAVYNFHKSLALLEALVGQPLR